MVSRRNMSLWILCFYWMDMLWEDVVPSVWPLNEPKKRIEPGLLIQRRFQQFYQPNLEHDANAVLSSNDLSPFDISLPSNENTDTREYLEDNLGLWYTLENPPCVVRRYNQVTDCLNYWSVTTFIMYFDEHENYGLEKDCVSWEAALMSNRHTRRMLPTHR